jgi:hypothetical protein
MPQLVQPKRAQLWHIEWNDKQKVIYEKKRLEVQFNPESLKVAFSNQQAGGDAAGGNAIQFVGPGTTKLSVELLFDVTGPRVPSAAGDPADVRRLTKEVVYFMTPVKVGGGKSPGKKGKKTKDKYVIPGIRFLWGSFLFEGVLTSMNETLEYFSTDGRPLRASVTVEMSAPKILDAEPAKSRQPGTDPQRELGGDQPVHAAAAADGRPSEWRDYADQAELENPRRPGRGARVPVRQH